jgi:hypothetical protein
VVFIGVWLLSLVEAFACKLVAYVQSYRGIVDDPVLESQVHVARNGFARFRHAYARPVRYTASINPPYDGDVDT